jgi:hypothetical protein
MAQFTPKIPDWSPEGPTAGPNFSIPEDKWPVIQKAYGDEIPPAAREEIEQSIRVYLDHLGGEHGSASIAVVREEIAGIQKALSSLAFALAKSSGNAEQDAFRDRWLNLTYLQVHGRQNTPGDDPADVPAAEFPLRDFRAAVENTERMAADWVVLCDYAREGLERKYDFRGRRDNETWENWVRTVTEICSRHGLPAANRKDGRGLSPFVELIDALQGCFPPSISFVARFYLANAIDRARRRAQKP